MLRYLSAEIVCPEKRTVVRERSSRKSESFEEQIMTKDKYSSTFSRSVEDIRDLRKTRWQRQRERHQTKGLIRKTIAVYLRIVLCTFLPSSANQRQTTNLPRFLTTGTTTAGISYFSLEVNAFVAYCFNTDRYWIVPNNCK